MMLYHQSNPSGLIHVRRKVFTAIARITQKYLFPSSSAVFTSCIQEVLAELGNVR